MYTCKNLAQPETQHLKRAENLSTELIRFIMIFLFITILPTKLLQLYLGKHCANFTLTPCINSLVQDCSISIESTKKTVLVHKAIDIKDSQVLKPGSDMERNLHQYKA